MPTNHAAGVRVGTLFTAVLLCCAGCGDHGGVKAGPDAGASQDADPVSANGGDANTTGANASGGPRPGSTGADLDASSPDGAVAPGAPSFPAVTDYAAAGPFEVLSEPTDGTCTVYRPKTLGEEGRLHPVIIWGNGTGTPTVEVYSGFFSHWASHGFIVAAAHTATAGSGMEMLACLAWVEAEHARAGSAYEGHVDLGNVGASGHSQGGGGTVIVGQDPRVRATVPLQAWMGGSPEPESAEMHQTGPMFLVSGDADVVAAPEANQKPIFEVSNVPTFWGTLAGGDHVTIALGTVAKYLAPTVAWFRLHLMHDENARSMFYGKDCTLCTNPEWTVQRKMID